MKYIAIWLSMVCLIGFAIQLISTEPFLLIYELKFSEPWRLITSIFVHGGIVHLLSNLFALVLFGLILEGRIGAKRVFMLFIITGIIVNIFSPYPRSLGASGAIYGIIGALVVLRPTMVMYIEFLPMPMFLAGVFWLFQDIFGIFYPSGTANLAHIMGLFVGLGAGFYWRKVFGDKRTHTKRIKDEIMEKQLDDWEQLNMR